MIQHVPGLIPSIKGNRSKRLFGLPAPLVKGKKNRSIYPVVAEITMVNDSKALLRQTRRSYFMRTLDFMEGEVLYELIHPLKRCKEQGVTDDSVCF